LNQALKLTVAENMWLGRFPKYVKKLPFLNTAEMIKRTREIFDSLGIEQDPEAKM
jgi:ABC-type sugar transport system ATPase subunit